MPYGIYLPGRWRSQPQGAVEVDWGHPLARGLRSVIIPPGRVFTDGVSQAANTRSAVTPIGYTTTGTQPQSGRRVDIIGDHTVVGVLWINQPSTTTAFSVGFGDLDVFGGGAGTVNASIINLSPFGFRIAESPPNTQAPAKSCVVAGVAKTNDYVTCYADGKLVGTSPSLYVTNGFSFSGYNRLDSYGGDGGVAFGAGWARALSPSEVSAISDNPYQLLRPRRPIVYSLPSSTPVLSAATVIDIGSTSARPRVTITYPA